MIAAHSQNSHPARRLLADVCFLLALALFLGCVNHAVQGQRALFLAPSNPGYSNLGSLEAAAVRRSLGRPGFLLVDARPAESFSKGTIPTSLSLPLHSNLDLASLEKLRAAQQVVVFCSDSRCNASKDLGVLLQQRGVARVDIFAGGMVEWRKLGYPVASAGPAGL